MSVPLSRPLMQVSVLLATRRRAELLGQTLAAMAHMSTVDLAWELVVVDNEGETTTREVCESFADRLPLRYLVCRTPGQNAARNYGLGAVRGELVVLSDDDMLPDADWLRELYQGAKRWPEHVLFGGRSLPNWPGKVPDFEIDEDIGHWTYCICDPPLPDGPDPRFLPISTNMAIRRRVFEYGLTFDESIGPNGRDYAMGSETEFNLRLGRLGFTAVFLPKAVVHNVVQADQLDRKWVLGRAFREGRGETRLQAPLSWCVLARLTKRALWATARYSWGGEYGIAARIFSAGAFPVP